MQCGWLKLSIGQRKLSNPKEKEMENTFKNRQLIADVLSLAKSHLGEGEMASSAELCYKTAHDIMCRTLHNDHADITGADYHALRSLAYSVGLSHPDYKIAERIFAG
jgi:hypothetical protein